MKITMNNTTIQNLPQCPRCHVARPSFSIVGGIVTTALTNQGLSNLRYFSATYKCTTCDRMVTVESPITDGGKPDQIEVQTILPEPNTIAKEIVGKSHHFLVDALTSLNAPTASIMASCSAIDSMLKDRGIGRRDENNKDRSLYNRIEIAVTEGVLTKEMSEWAHRIRLDANDQRHADEDAKLPTIEKAQEVLDLAKGLGEVLFVLPEKALAQEAREDKPE